MNEVLVLTSFLSAPNLILAANISSILVSPFLLLVVLALTTDTI